MGHGDAVQLLIQSGAKVGGECCAELLPQTIHHLSSVKALLNAGVNLNALNRNGETALNATIRIRPEACFSLLLSREDIDVDVEARSCGTVLQTACLIGDFDAVLALLDRGADPNVKTPDIIGATPLIAALIGNVVCDEFFKVETAHMDQIVRMLVDRGANIHSRMPGSVFYTALLAACLGGSVSTISLLLEQGASPDEADPVTGRRPLHHAAANGFDNFERIALACSGNIMVVDKAGKSCLHWAAQYGNVKTIESIIAKLESRKLDIGTYIDLPDVDGWTPLRWALRPDQQCELSHLTRSEKPDLVVTVQTLLYYGADPSPKCLLPKRNDSEGPPQRREW